MSDDLKQVGVKASKAAWYNVACAGLLSFIHRRRCTAPFACCACLSLKHVIQVCRSHLPSNFLQQLPGTMIAFIILLLRHSKEHLIVYSAPSPLSLAAAVNDAKVIRVC